MVAEGAVPALRMCRGCLAGRRTPLPRSVPVTLVTFLLMLLSACASVDVRMLSSQTFPPESGPVQMLDRAPARPYVQIAVLTVDSWWSSEDSRREQIREKAAELGADAVIFGAQQLSPPPQNNRVEEPNSPPPSNPAEDNGQKGPQDLHPSSYVAPQAGEVTVFLVHGRGGGRRGGHGHGGYWGRPGPPGFRPGGHLHFHRRWGGGFYEPGWWGPGPYWGWYDPYPGPYWGGGYYSPYSYYGAYRGYYPPSYGYTTTVTVGTAIRYTD